MKKLRGAVIGCGYISEFHLRGWARIPEVEIRALADPDRARADERRACFAPDARVYESMESLLAAEELDFVDILSPARLHRGHCLRAADAGVHVICQPIDDYVQSFFQLQRDFTDAVLHGTPPPQPTTENLRSLRLAFAAYESARMGAAATLAEFPA